MTNYLFRHDDVRPFQKDLMHDMGQAIKEGRNLMAMAPTGLGKTDASLSAAITHALEEKLTVFFLTPKISQHKIALEAVSGIAQRHDLGIRAVDMIGRWHCCIDDGLKELDNEGFQAACTRRRKNEECVFYANAKGFNRQQEALASTRFKMFLKGYGSAMGAGKLIASGLRQKCCPYEWMVKMAEISDVIIADYYHLMVPSVRDMFLAKTKKRIEDSIVIVDEAHNLASRVRDSLSSGIGTGTFARVEKEMRFLELESGPIAPEFSKWAGQMLDQDKECVVLPTSFDMFFERFGMGREEAAERLGQAGLEFIERTGKKSACLKAARFLSDWGESQLRSVRILRRSGENHHLTKRLLDPSPSTRILNQCHSSILMSGTLMPLEMHRDILGLDKERTTMKEYPSPFDPANTVNIVASNLTTRYSRRDAEGYRMLAYSIDKVVQATPGGVAVFFPSYKVMDSVLALMRSRDLLVQRPKMRPEEVGELIKSFQQGGTLVGVQGGSLAEGVDFNQEEIKTAVIVGVALDEMDAEASALIDFYEERYGRGWDYGYLYPGTIKALQAAGRGRRKESDRVAVVYMDERFRWQKYNWVLSRRERMVVTDSPADEVGRFWAQRPPDR